MVQDTVQNVCCGDRDCVISKFWEALLISVDKSVFSISVPFSFPSGPLHIPEGFAFLPSADSDFIN